MSDYDRVASLFTPDGALRMPNVPVELVGVEEISAWRERREAFRYLDTTPLTGAPPRPVGVPADRPTGATPTQGRR